MKVRMTGDFGQLEIGFGRIGGHGERIAKEFLGRLLEQIVVRSTQYYDAATKARRYPGDRDHVFTYYERQFHSVVCPAISDLTPFYLFENPLRRKPSGEKEYPGRVDYWIYYKKYSFMLELKHIYLAYMQPDDVRGRVMGRFSEALQQLGKIRKSECKNLVYGNGLRKIALEAVVFYRGSREKSDLKVDMKRRDFRVLFAKRLGKIKGKCTTNVNALWVLDKRLITPFEYSNTFEIYPAVGFIGYISDIIV